MKFVIWHGCRIVETVDLPTLSANFRDPNGRWFIVESVELDPWFCAGSATVVTKDGRPVRSTPAVPE